jgi:membrane-bound serine protease (ClpP class)
MVDERKFIEGITDSGEVLTFTTSEAIKYNYCEGQAESIEEVLKIAKITDYEIIEYKTTFLDDVIGFLMNPVLQGILIMLIVGGIYFELQSPGIGFALIVAVTSAVLYFAPLYLEGLAENWELAIFAVGLILLIIEIFAIPGFGVAGISGIVLMVAGLTMSMIDNIIFDFDLDLSQYFVLIFKNLMLVIISMIISLITSIILANRLFENKSFSFIKLDAEQKQSEGYVSTDLSLKLLIGKTGIAFTILRPSGKVEIGNEVYDAKAINGYIEKGEKIIVELQEAGQLYVKKL